MSLCCPYAGSLGAEVCSLESGKPNNTRRSVSACCLDSRSRSSKRAAAISCPLLCALAASLPAMAAFSCNLLSAKYSVSSRLSLFFSSTSSALPYAWPTRHLKRDHFPSRISYNGPEQSGHVRLETSPGRSSLFKVARSSSDIFCSSSTSSAMGYPPCSTPSLLLACVARRLNRAAMSSNGRQ